MAKILDLFEAYSSGELPRDGGFIITEHLDDSSRYAIYEVISYGNVKSIYNIDEGEEVDVQSIIFNGNSEFDDEDLKSEFE